MSNDSKMANGTVAISRGEARRLIRARLCEWYPSWPERAAEDRCGNEAAWFGVIHPDEGETLPVYGYQPGQPLLVWLCRHDAPRWLAWVLTISPRVEKVTLRRADAQLNWERRKRAEREANVL